MLPSTMGLISLGWISPTRVTYLCTKLVFSLEFCTYEWWSKQNSFIFPSFLCSSLKREVTYYRQVSTYPPCAWPPELITSHIPWWFYRDWKLGSRVCYARELIKNFIAGGKLMCSSLFVLYFYHLSQSQESNCLLHISNRCWGVEKVSRIHSSKKTDPLGSLDGSEPIKMLLLTCLSSPLKYLTFI